MSSAKNFLKKYWFITSMLIGIVAGCIVGAVWPGATALEPLGTVFINLMFCVVVPMVFCSIASAIANMKSAKRAGKVMGTTVITFFVTAGIAAIRMSIVGKYLIVLLTMGIIGLAVTYAYVYFVCRKLFPAYTEQQFLAMYGMLTGTASTGIILLREIDGDFKTPVADNLVYQNFPAMVFGFPILLLATMAPTKPYTTLAIVVVFLVAINILLLRSLIFKKKK